MRFIRTTVLLIYVVTGHFDASGQLALNNFDCVYPIIFVHGWKGDGSSWEDIYGNENFAAIWGPIADTYLAFFLIGINLVAGGAENGAAFRNWGDLKLEDVYISSAALPISQLFENHGTVTIDGEVILSSGL